MMLKDEEIEEWLKDRLGEGNRFEQFNRRFCKDLAKTQDQLTLKGVKEKLYHRPIPIESEASNEEVVKIMLKVREYYQIVFDEAVE